MQWQSYSPCTCEVKEFAHGNRTRDCTKKTDHQPLDPKGQRPYELIVIMMVKIILIFEYLALGSTQRRVAVRVGMLARKVTNMVRKREARKMGRRGQEAGQGPGVAIIRVGGKSRDEGEVVVGDEGRHEQLVKRPWSRARHPA